MADMAGAYMAEHGVKFFKKCIPTKVVKNKLGVVIIQTLLVGVTRAFSLLYKSSVSCQLFLRLV